VQTLSGHQKKVGAIKWHPTADNLMASAGADYIVKVWDVETGQGKYKSDGAQNLIQSVDWNYDASLLCTNSKDKIFRIIDPRQQTVVSQCESHVGVKGGRALWLGKHNLCVLLVSEQVHQENLNSTIQERWNPHSTQVPSNLLLVSLCRFMMKILICCSLPEREMVLLNFMKLTQLRNLNTLCSILVNSHQITQHQPLVLCLAVLATFLQQKLLEFIKFSLKGTVVPLHFQVPRRSEVFSEELYPPARGDEPALTKEEWFEGKNSTPKLISLEGGFVTKEKTTASFTQNASSAEDAPKDLKLAYEELKRKVAALESEIEKKDALIAELQSK